MMTIYPIYGPPLVMPPWALLTGLVLIGGFSSSRAVYLDWGRELHGVPGAL